MLMWRMHARRALLMATCTSNPFGSDIKSIYYLYIYCLLIVITFSWGIFCFSFSWGIVRNSKHLIVTFQFPNHIQNQTVACQLLAPRDSLLPHFLNFLFNLFLEIQIMNLFCDKKNLLGFFREFCREINLVKNGHEQQMLV